MNDIGTFTELPVKGREMTGEMFDEAPAKHLVSGLVELDVTRTREFMHSHKEKTGETLSFTGWLVKCIGQAVTEHKEVQAYKKGKKKLIVFDDVDIGITVERTVRGQKVPVGYIVRKANEKTFRQIHDEIRAAQAQKVDGALLGESSGARFVRIFQSMPRFLRKIVWWRFRKDPFLKKKVMGTVGITAVGMFGNIGGWPIPFLRGFQTLGFGIGGISKRPGVANDKIEIREYLNMIVMFDHDVVDGAPAARFVARLAELIQEGFGLVE